MGDDKDTTPPVEGEEGAGDTEEAPAKDAGDEEADDEADDEDEDEDEAEAEPKPE